MATALIDAEVMKTSRLAGASWGGGGAYLSIGLWSFRDFKMLVNPWH